VANEPPSVRYLSADEVWAMNDLVLRAEGSASVLRDRGALESAVARPANAAHYVQADLASQAAVLIAGVALGHPFLDANKRTATAAAATFLRLNGLRVASGGDAFGREVEAMVLQHDRDAQAATEALAEWLRVRLEPLPAE
jgi:death-on-curing protein